MTETSMQWNRQMYTNILCTNCVQKILNNILFLDVFILGDLQYIVEAGTGIEPVYTDLQLIHIL